MPVHKPLDNLKRRPLLKRIPIPVLVLFAIDVLLAVAYLGDRLLGRPFGPIVTRLIDLNAERNIPTWFSSMQLFLVGMLFLVLACVLTERKVRGGIPLFFLLALTFFGLSLDEFAGIHEEFAFLIDALLLPGGDRADTIFARTGIWMFVLGIPFLIFMLLLVRSLHRHIAGAGVTRLFLVGFAVFLVSATGTEMLTNFVYERPFWRMLQAVAEEFGEMVGVTIMFWASYRLLQYYGINYFGPGTGAYGRGATDGTQGQ